MAIPDYESLMLPVLRLVGAGTTRIKDVTEAVSAEFGLSADERQQLLPSGQQSYIANRVGWAKTYLKKAGLLENARRGMVAITDEGRMVLESKPTQIDREFLNRYQPFRDFIKQTATREQAIPSGARGDSGTPDDVLRDAYSQINDALADDLLAQVKATSPAYFEKIVVDLLLKMGYGGSRADAGKRVGRVDDEGIDGVIDEDKLGLDKIVVQAKRYRDIVVGRPAIQAFAGSMEGHKARKGVFITTSTFSGEARAWVERIERRIVLIDGRELAALMIEHDVGVSTKQVIRVKRIDTDYFVEDE